MLGVFGGNGGGVGLEGHFSNEGVTVIGDMVVLCVLENEMIASPVDNEEVDLLVIINLPLALFDTGFGGIGRVLG